MMGRTGGSVEFMPAPFATVSLSQDLKRRLYDLGIETLFNPGQIKYPNDIVLEPPCSLKWLRIERDLILGAFSYFVSGYCYACTIGRYTSIGEEVNIGRQDHPIDWLSTSPFQYLDTPLFDVGDGFPGAAQFHAYRSHLVGVVPGTVLKRTIIGHDVWIGHGAFIRAGVTIGTGAIVAAQSVVVKDVPPYAIVGGNPAHILRARIPEHISERLLATRWWRFAPWQLTGIAFHELEKSIDQIEEIASTASPYEPGKIHLGDIASEATAPAATSAE